MLFGQVMAMAGRAMPSATARAFPQGRDPAAARLAAARADRPGRAAPHLGAAGHAGRAVRDRGRAAVRADRAGQAHQAQGHRLHRDGASRRRAGAGADGAADGERLPAAGAGSWRDVLRPRRCRRWAPVSRRGRAGPGVPRGAGACVPGAAQRGAEARRPGARPRRGPAADPYLTLVGYFNALRELGAMRRVVEDEVPQRTASSTSAPAARQGRARTRCWRRACSSQVVELTSRESTAKIKDRPSTGSPSSSSRRSPTSPRRRGAGVEHDLGRRRHQAARAHGGGRAADDRRRVHPVDQPRRARSPPARPGGHLLQRAARARPLVLRAVRSVPPELLRLGRGHQRHAILEAGARSRAGGRCWWPWCATATRRCRRPAGRCRCRAPAVIARAIAALRERGRSPGRRRRRGPGRHRARAGAGPGGRVEQQGRRGARREHRARLLARSTSTRRGWPRRCCCRAAGDADDAVDAKFAAPTSMRDTEPTVHLWLRYGLGRKQV